jgi:hypothetical protein
LQDFRFFNGTITCEGYAQVILWQLFPELREEERLLWLVSARLSYFPHCTYVYANFDTFRDRNISTDIWQAHSPDINPYDIFFCGPLQDKV